MKTVRLTLMILTVALVSCSGIGSSIKLSDASSTANIEKILSESFDGDAEVYDFTLYAGILEDELKNINRIYKHKNTFFWQEYYVSSGGFDDPIKKVDAPYLKKTPFKISDIDVSIIPVKYQEALALLKEKELFDENKTYYLNNWVFTSDRDGAIISTFTIQYRVGSVSTGRQTEITYDDFSFSVNSSNELKQIN
ncbi:hypothetical protein [uncultured Winogradskyella sp.]|uniref:hypothetical protein n=1 Tax=uncultured Winogradskyella sp. TaxID=395353 RepID=UPI002621AE95|nr:hypothetical protein [uncultured Winogradskyella sp.]